MKVDEVQVKHLTEKWQAILRLRDWDIATRVVEPPWRKSGDIKIDQPNGMAVLMINRTPRVDNLEELVVHELLHLKLYRMDQMLEHLLSILYGDQENDPKRQFAQGQFMDALETTVEDLTKGYLACSASADPPSMSRLMKEVDEEAGKSR